MNGKQFNFDGKCKMRKIKQYSFILVILLTCFGVDTATSAATEKKRKEKEYIDFKSIKKVLKNDMLDVELEKKLKKKREIGLKIKKKRMRKYDIPQKTEYWSFFTEYWLVKNAPILKWDFEKPDYGLSDSFSCFLEKLGYYEKRFKILLVNTPNLYHFGLPSNKGEYIFILSVPFIRTLDLSKLEISMLLFEDLLRVNNGYFKNFAETGELKKILGTNFYKKKIDKKIFTRVSDKYDKMIFDTGFNYQQQFEITKRIGRLLKSDLKLWNTYLGMLKKIDTLVKSNVLYSGYVKIYPSPEMQLNWLLPELKDGKF